MITRTIAVLCMTMVFASLDIRTVKATDYGDDNEQSQDQYQGQKQGQIQDQDQAQDQSQDQGQDQSQSQDSEQANEQNVNIDARRASSGVLSSGDSTADDQKVFSFTGGWLTGNAGLRLDLTDKDARKLRFADTLRDRGLIAAADEMECSAKFVQKVLGKGAECLGKLRAVREQQATALEALQQRLDDLERQSTHRHEVIRSECDEKAEKAHRSCVTK